MRYVFLDVDGVLNNRYTKNDSKTGYLEGLASIDFKNMDCFRAIMDRFYKKYGEENVRIVLSSSWRAGEDAKDIERYRYSLRRILDIYLEKWGLKIDEEIPILPYEYSRGAEIVNYLSSHLTDLENYIVLDDHIFEDFKKYHILRHLVQSSYDSRGGFGGLLEKHINYAERIMANEIKDDELESIKDFRISF